MRLIDADALIDRMYHDAFETDTDMQKWDSGCWIRYKMFENAIDEQPTIGPNRGEWLNYKDEHTCSVCKEVVISDWYDEYEWYDYCPNCGADMREEIENDN